MKECLSRCLFRYRSLEGESFSRTETVVRDSKMYFANPSSFNDPFDCRPVFSLDGSPAEVRKYFQNLYRNQAPHLDRSSRRAEIRKAFKDHRTAPNRAEALISFGDFYYSTIASRVGLLCLTEKPDDLLMWSHYASSHKGICLGFDKEAASFAIAQIVHYQDERPNVNPVQQDPEAMLDRALLTKGSHWAYERERRVVNYKGGARNYQHPPSDLLCIILGAQISDQHRQAVRKWALEHPTSPALYQAELSPKDFSLSLSPLRA